MIFLGQKLRTLRNAMGWSADEVSRRTGLRQSIISDLETGQTKNPRPATVKKLCEGINIDEEYFFIQEALLPEQIMPDIPDTTLKFIMTGENIPYLVISEKAKKNGISPELLQQALDLLIANRNIRK